MVNVLSVVAAHVSRNVEVVEFFFMMMAGGVMSLGMAMVLAIIVQRILEAHRWNVARMKARPVESWNRLATEFFETAPDFNEVAYAANPHGCMTVIRPTFGKPMVPAFRPAPLELLDAPDFDVTLARTVMARRR